MSLKEKVIQSTIYKGIWYDIWLLEVNSANDFGVTDRMEEARNKLSMLEYDCLHELMEQGYILYDDKENVTFKLGGNKDDDYLRAIAYVWTVENGLITESENDYYEVAKQQAEITNKYLENK